MNRNHQQTANSSKNFMKSLKRLFAYLRPYYKHLIIVIVFAILSTSFSIVGPKILGKAITKLFEGLMMKFANVPNASIDFNYIGHIIIILVVIYLISFVFNAILGVIITNVSQKVAYDLRNKINKKINKIPLAYFDKTSYGNILSIVTNDIDTISMSLNQALSSAISSITLLLGILIMMISISISMTLVSIITLPISMVLIGIIIKKSQKYFKIRQQKIGKINGYIEESYSAHNIIKAYNKEKETIKKFNQINDDLYESSWKSSFYSGLMMPIIQFLSNIGYVLVSVMGGYFVIKKTINIGDIQAFIQYVRQLSSPMAQMGQVIASLQSTAAASERVFDFLDVPEEVSETSTPQVIDNVKGSINFNKVIFSYDKQKNVIENLNIKIKSGERVAIVGPTGAGKTTLVNLLLRFYDIDNGSITIDDINIKDMKRSYLRKLFGMVLQDSWLFNGSIKDNIVYGNEEATDKDIKKVIVEAQLDHFINTLPDGYNTIIDEESSNISVGQKQLITIARALLANPQILILDEATSSVDTRTEILIQEALDKLMKNKTSFIIAHRLSTIRNADLILVMKNGQIIEHGKHQQLLNKNGFYAELYNSQFETTIVN